MELCQIIMKRFTISAQDDLKKELDSLDDIKWVEVARKGIEDKLKQLEKFEALKKVVSYNGNDYNTCSW
jgi:hypothetical protein